MSLLNNLTNQHFRCISEQEFNQWEASGDCLETDSRGIKVLRLEQGQYLKLFRVKRWYSSANWNDYAKRFSNNASRLTEMGVPTVEVTELVRVPHLERTGAIYQPLAGDTYRDIIKRRGLSAKQIVDYGHFFAELHQLGIYFRSPHLGNIIISPQHQLGLIDIADIKFYRRPLSLANRARNFSHLFRYKGDSEALGRHGTNVLIDAYLENSNLKSSQANKLRKKVFDLSTDRYKD